MLKPISVVLYIVVLAHTTHAQSSAFTYQGRLNTAGTSEVLFAGSPENGNQNYYYGNAVLDAGNSQPFDKMPPDYVLAFIMRTQ